MPDVSTVAALDVLIGLIFVYFVLSVACSAFNEILAQIMNLRARDLERGIRNLLADNQLVGDFFNDPRVTALVKPRLLGGGRKPSYIPSRVFALALLDTVSPPPAAGTPANLVERATSAISTVPNDALKRLLQDAVVEAGTDVEKLRSSLERSFNEVMDRASGWYKRRVQYILLALAALLVGFINADTFTIAERLWKDDALRAAVVAQAQEQQSATDCPTDDNTTDDNPVDRATACLDQAESLGIPLGWTSEPLPEDAAGWLGKLLGLAITALALSLGAPFWFDLLGKVSRLRASGPRELPTSEEGRGASAPEQTRPTA